MIASGDVTTRRRALDVLATTGCAAVMVGRAAQGNPWVLAEIMGERRRATPRARRWPRSSCSSCGETVRELGEQRATGFLKKFYGWYLGRGRFPKPFKQELVQLDSIGEVEQRLFAAAPGARDVLAELAGDTPGCETRPP